MCRFLFCKSWSTSMMRCMSINNQSIANINIQFRFNFGFHNFQTMCCTYESWMHFLFLGNVFQFSENVFLVSGNVFHWHLRSLGALIDRGANVRCISSDWLREDKPQRFYNYQLSRRSCEQVPCKPFYIGSIIGKDLNGFSVIFVMISVCRKSY